MKRARVSDLARLAHIFEGLIVARTPAGLKRLREFIRRGQVLISRHCAVVVTWWRHTVHIRYFAVHPDRRRNGYGRRAVKRLLRWIRLGGFARVSLTAYRGNRGARAFWLAAGFEIYARFELRARMERRLT